MASSWWDSLSQDRKTELPAQSGSCGKFSEYHAGGGSGAKKHLCQVLHVGQETEILCNCPKRADVVLHVDSSEIPAATQWQAGMQGQAGCQPAPANQSEEASPGRGWGPTQ